MAEYIADNGTTITEATIDEWADQADRAFQDDPVTLTPVEGRPWETTSPMRPRTIRLPDALWDLVEAKAHQMFDVPTLSCSMRSGGVACAGSH